MNDIDVKLFGAVGDGVADDTAAFQAAIGAAGAPSAATRRVTVPKGTYNITSGLTSLTYVSLIGDGSKLTALKFYGSGWAVSCMSPIEVSGFSVASMSQGQSGVLIKNGTGVRVRDILITDFDTTGFQLGTTGGGVYFADVDYVELNNSIVSGVTALRIDGGSIPASNSNICRNIFAKGRWATYYDLHGNSNIIIGSTAEPNNSALPVSEVYHFRGSGNKVIGPYVEPVGATIPAVFFRFAATAQGCRAEGVHWTATDYSTYSKIADLGTNNEVSVNQIGFNFTPSPGSKGSQDNLLFNAGFYNLKPTGLPAGWSLGFGSTGTATRDTTTIRGGPYSMKLECSATKATIYATATPGKLKSQTIHVGVWCWSATPGFGAVKVQAGGSLVGGFPHSGSGTWEFLTASVRAESSPAEAKISLQSNKDNLNSTGVCYFSEPILVVGNEIPQAAMPRQLNDVEANLAGRLTWNAPATLEVNSPTPNVSEGNFFKEANTSATTITNFAGGVAGQEIKILVGSANTTVAHNANIQTKSVADIPLTVSAVYKFINDGQKWFEY